MPPTSNRNNLNKLRIRPFLCQIPFCSHHRCRRDVIIPYHTYTEQVMYEIFVYDARLLRSTACKVREQSA